MSDDTPPLVEAHPPYNQAHRPQFHFSPPAGWQNDPNGLVYYQGEYHLFYQHYPHSRQPRFDLMSWGHAVSPDLLHWQHLPLALTPDELGSIWSGSVVVDWHDTTGFFEGQSGLVAIFTHYRDGLQSQSIAFSRDNGRRWTKYPGNPVLPNPGLADFRDPKVLWYAPGLYWVMVLATGDRVTLYRSPDLKGWEKLSEFGGDMAGPAGGTWECPDLFELAVAGHPPGSKWVLLNSLGGTGLYPQASVRYIVGQFDGRAFSGDNEAGAAPLWLDYGHDHYAEVTWSDIPASDGRRLMIGWLSNWLYPELPTSPWRGMMTIPRELELRPTPQGLRLTQKPIRELASLRTEALSWFDQPLTGETAPDLLQGIEGDCLEIIAEFEPGTAREFGLRLRAEGQHATVVGYKVAEEQLFIDRSKAGPTDFHPGFGAVHSGPLDLEGGRLRLHLLLDRCCLEVFGGDGRLCLSDLIFPDPSSRGLALYSRDGGVMLHSLQIYRLKSIWESAPARPVSY